MPTEDAKLEEQAASDAEAAAPVDEQDERDEQGEQDEKDGQAEAAASEAGGDDTGVGADRDLDAGEVDADAMAEKVAGEVDEVAEEMEEILDDVSAAETERDEFRDHLMRLQADFDNYRKRVHKEMGEAGDKALGRFVEELLPVLDAIDAARAHGASEVDQVANLLVDLLAKQGLERVGAEGDVFDPNLHDAVIYEAGDEDVQTVVQVLRAGWRWRDRVLRPAMVKVLG